MKKNDVFAATDEWLDQDSKSQQLLRAQKERQSDRRLLINV